MLSLNVLSVRGQTCNNYGILSAGTCTDCPSGIGGADCASLLCGSGLVQPQSRPVFSAALSDNPEQGCASQCTSGWTGPTCNVPQSAAACQAGAVSSGVNDITLNSGAYVWTEGASTCDVIVCPRIWPIGGIKNADSHAQSNRTRLYRACLQDRQRSHSRTHSTQQTR